MKQNWLKKAFYSLFGIILLLLISASIVLSFLDWNEYREEMSAIASDQLDMRVELAGDVSFTLFPRPSVGVETVSLAPNTEGFSEPVATAERIQMLLGFSSFLRGDLAIQSLVLDGVSVTLAETDEHAWKIKGWPVAENSESANVEMAFERLSISGGELKLEFANNSVRTVTGISLDIEGSLPKGPLEWDGSFLSNGQLIKSSGRMRPVAVRDEVSLKTDIIIDGAVIELAGRISGEGNITGRIIAKGDGLQTAVTSFEKILGSEPIIVPDLPYAIDVQLDRKATITRLVSRELSLGETQGRLDVTLANHVGVQHATGSVALGVIDADTWLKAIPTESNTVETITAGTDALNVESTSIFGGALDITIEGVEIRGGLGQRIDAVLSFRQDGVKLTSLQALLPGASTLTFSGALASNGGDGKIDIKSGNLKGLMAWLNIDTPAMLPAGRLSAAEIAANIAVGGQAWTIDNIQGKIDTTAFSGGISGGISSPAPSHILLRIPTLNLDAYLTDSSNKAEAETGFALPDVTTNLDVSIGTLLFRQSELEELKLVASLAGGKLNAKHFSVAQSGAIFTGSGEYTETTPSPTIDMNGEFVAWPTQIGAFGSDEFKARLHALNFDLVSGTFSASGALEALRIGADVSNGRDKILLTGDAGYRASEFNHFNIQGSISHRDLSSFVKQITDFNPQNLPTELAVSASKAATENTIVFKAGGEVSRGKLSAEGRWGDTERKINFSLDHDDAGSFIANTGVDVPLIDQTQNLRADIGYLATEEGETFKINNFKNGTGTLVGDIVLSASKQLSGKVSVTDWNVQTAIKTEEPNEQLDLSQLAEYAGSLDVRLQNVVVGGQAISLPQAKFTIGDAALQFSMGPNASINGRPLTGNVSAILENEQPFEGRLKTDGINLANFLSAQGYKAFASSDVSGDLSFSGKLAGREPIIETISGTGEFTGQGGALEFIGVPNLVAQMQSAKSSRGFLGNIGGLLRAGSTPMDSLNAKFTVDSGVMLLETASASGSWGKFGIDGQLNFVNDFLSVKGELALTNPQDTPAIPVNYTGSFTSPTVNWQSRVFERFVIAGIERRIRSVLFKELETRDKDGKNETPGVAVFSRAFGLLGALQKAQEKQKQDQLKKEAETKAAVQGTEERKP